jgi:hypothetical protein
MKMGRVFFAAMVIGGLVLSSICFGYSDGSGTPEEPYQIANKEDLLTLAGTIADYNKCFILTADINTGGQVFTTAIIAADTVAGNYSFDGTAFTGTFDGNGHKITHFTINGGSNQYLGLFGYISSGGSVKNLGLENFDISGSYCVGGLAGDSGGSISNCYSTGSVSGTDRVGGLVGFNESSISNCYATGSVSGPSGSSGVGGLVGRNHGNISNCYSTGSVSGYSCVGGLVGVNVGSISNCYSMGTVSGYEYVGGLVGDSSGSISNCYSTGSVSGYQYVGGLVGYNAWGSSIISNCYATGAVSGSSGSSNVGGLVGRNYGNISNCYSTGSVSGYSYVGGLVGYNDGGSVISSFWDTETSGQTTSAGGEGKTTAEMKQINTFANWDFVETWGIEDNQTYPFLKLIYPVGDLNHDKVVNFLDFAILANNWLEGL